MSDRPAYWRMPTIKQLEKMAQERARIEANREPQPPSTEAEWWNSVMADERAAGRPALPIQQRRLSEIPRPLLRVECARCSRTVEIQRLDAIRLFGPHTVWKDAGQKLLDDGCQHRTGRHEEDGCWPRCGVSDTYENVMDDAKAFATEMAARSLQKTLKNASAGSSFISYKPGRIETRNYRFILDGIES